MTIAPTRSTPAPGPTAHPTGRRHAWVDVARGFVVVMVVVMHLGIYHFLPMTTGETSNAFWSEVSAVLQVLRMPSLLILSGWLAASRVRAGLGSARTRRTIAANAYLYVLWLGIYCAAAAALGATEMAQAPSPQNFLPQLLMPYSTLWFLAALAWYTAGLAALRRVPPTLVLAGLFALGWLSTNLWPVEMGLWANIPHLAIFFAVGVYARPAVEAIGQHPALALGGGGGSAVMLAEIVGTLQEGALPTYPVVVAQSLAGVAAVFGAACLATRYAAPLTKPVAWLGRRTLAIYALHYLAIMAVSTVASGRLYDVDRALLASPAGRWVYPLVATGAIVLAAVAIHEAAQRLGLRWLVAMPHRPAALVRQAAAARARIARYVVAVAPLGDLARRPRPERRVPAQVDFAEFEELPPRLTLVPVG